MRGLLILMIMFCFGCSMDCSEATKFQTATTPNENVETQFIKSVKDKVNKVVTHVTLTCYQPVAEQCDGDYLHTADNSEIDLKKLKSGKLKWVAISQDLLWLIPMGSKVKISDEESGKCYGIYTVKDKMHKRWNHRMDILIHPSSEERIYAENIRVELV
jgi:3D (Asp-Asp-Asp) domain-containing protein